MKPLTTLLTGTLLAVSLVGTANAEEWTRERLTEQPIIGEVDYAHVLPQCHNGSGYTVGVSLTLDRKGAAYYELDPTISSHDEASKYVRDKKPFAFLFFKKNDQGERELYVDVKPDGKFDFEQSSKLQNPCQVRDSLDKYVIK